MGWPELTKGRRVFGVLKGDTYNVPWTKNCPCTFQIQQSETHTQDAQDVESHGGFVRISYFLDFKLSAIGHKHSKITLNIERLLEKCRSRSPVTL